jgi:hypothetical protein
MTNPTPNDPSPSLADRAIDLVYIVVMVATGIMVLGLPIIFGDLEVMAAIAAIWLICMPVYMTIKFLRLVNRTKPVHPSIKANIFLSMFLTVTSLIAFSACEYTYFGLRDTSIPLDATHDGIVRDGVKSLYFSVVTWTTLGYGDFVPANDFTRFFAAWEALTGYVVMAVLVAALVSTFRSRPIQ